MPKRTSTLEIGANRKNRKKSQEETMQEKTALVRSNEDDVAVMKAYLEIDSTKARSFDAIKSKVRAMMTEVFKNVITMVENYDAQTRALVENNLKSTNSCAVSVWGGSRLKRTSEPPLLGAPMSQMLKEKWDKQHICEMEVYLQRLTLLKEECMMGLKELNKAESDTGK